MSRHIVAACLCVLMAALAAFATPSTGAGAASSEQVVFSKTGAFGIFAGTPTPYGYWIWCEADSTNPSVGQCAGSLYFYGLSPKAQSVDGTISELSEGVYRMAVHTPNGWSCTLTNVGPVTSGPTNSIVTTCSTPAGSATATGAIVEVTGP